MPISEPRKMAINAQIIAMFELYNLDYNNVKN